MRGSIYGETILRNVGVEEEVEGRDRGKGENEAGVKKWEGCGRVRKQSGKGYEGRGGERGWKRRKR